MPDNNYKSYCDVDNIRVDLEVLKPANPSEYQDVFKLSHCTNSTFTRGEVYAMGCTENALDANRFCSAVIEDYYLSGGAQASVVIKGKSAITLKQVVINHDPKSWTDILVDDYSDQSKEASAVILDDVKRVDGKEVRVVFGRFMKPTFFKGNYKVLWITTIGLHIYNILKDLYVKFIPKKT